MLLRLLCPLALLILSECCYAQDTLYMRDGRVIDCEVESVDSSFIFFKRLEQRKGNLALSKELVYKIMYKTGAVSFLRTAQEQLAYNNNHSNNIITAAVNLNDEGYGFGAAFEHFPNNNNYYSFYLPVNYVTSTFNPKYLSRPMRSIIELLPGMKFYPTGKGRKICYAVGPQLVWERGSRGQENYISHTPKGNYYSPDITVPLERWGILLSNYMNMFLAKSLFIGLDLGLGSTVYNRQGSLSNVKPKEHLYRTSNRFLTQLNVRVGYRL